MMQEPVVIVANGDFPSHKVPLLILQDSGTIICCDGAANHLVKNGMEPNYILGDMDSIDDNLKNKYKERVIELPKQDQNDLRKTIDWVADKRVKKAAILGATGKRDDHSLANIFTLLQYPTPLEITMYSNYGIFSVVQGEKKFDSFTGQQISLFSTDSDIEVTSNNLKYNLNNKMLNTLYCGSLNESLDESFTLTVSHGKILVYQVFA
jgi:thiamine pyrophosphokinase